MLQFFNGWRRKAGVVMLVVACVLMVAWVRTTVMSDQLLLSIGGRTYSIGSLRGGFFLVCADQPRDELWEWVTARDEEMRQNLGNLSLPEVLADEFSHPECHYLFAHYLWIVMSFTAVSAYLILGKPRKRA